MPIRVELLLAYVSNFGRNFICAESF